MCATPNSTPYSNPTPSTSLQQNHGTKPEPKWLTMKKQNKSSAGKTAKLTAQKSLAVSSAQKPNVGTRNEKRARWAKKAVPKQKPVVKSGPVFGYTSVCCSAPATKPPCGTRTPMKDAESGKMKDKVSGLGRWRCSGCRKACKVTRHAPAAKVTDTKVLQAAVSAAPSAEARNAIIDAVVVTGEVPSAPTQS